MTKQQITNKIKDLEFWLLHNSSHIEYAINWQTKRDLERRLADKDYDDPG